MKSAWLVVGAMLVAGCSGSSPGSSGSTGGNGSTTSSGSTGGSGSSGSTGSGGWSNSFSQGSPVVQANAPSSTDSQPGGSDTWYVDMHDDTFSAHASDAHTDTSASFTIATSGNTITLTGSASATANLDSSTNLVPQCGSDADLGDPNLCYRSAGATSIHFAFDCSGSSASGVAANGGGVADVSVEYGTGGSNPQTLCILGSDVSADITSGAIDVPTDSTGQACIHANDALEFRWEASAGRPSDNSTTCTSTATAHIVITATAH